MRILNYNDYLRNYICIEAESSDSLECKNLYNKIKENTKWSRYVAGILYECAYLCCLDTLKYHPDDEQELENMEFFQEVSDIEDFISSMDKEMFDDFCDDVIYFHSLDFYTKKRMLEHALDEHKCLKEAFPCYLMDVLAYLNKYDASILIEQYYERLYKKDKTPFLNTVKDSVEELF